MHKCFINICAPATFIRNHLVLSVSLLLFSFILSGKINAQPCTSYLSGSYTVGAGGDFSTLTAAANAYNTSCITANVTFVLTNSTYNAPTESFPVVFNRNSTAGPTTRLSIVPQTGLTVTISGAVNNGALIKINGSYIEFNGRGTTDTSKQLFITNTSITEPRVIHLASSGLSGAVTNCSISNCVLTNGTTDKSVLLFSDNATFSTPGFFSNIAIQRNLFRKSLYGIFYQGATVATNGNGMLIANNDFSATGNNALSYSAIYLKGADGVSIVNNQIGNFLGTDTASDKGIFIADTVRNTLIAGNKIFNLNNTSGSGWGAHAIYIGTNLPNANITVVNNMIGNITGDGNNYTNATYTLENPTGILLSCSGTQGGIRIYNNTIALGTVSGFTNTLNRTGAVSSCIRLRAGSSAEIRNNLLYNTLGLSGSLGFGATCILLSQNANQLPVLDYNNYYVGPAGSGVKLLGHIFNGNIQSATLTSWRTATSKDVNSTNLIPQFVSTTDWHLSESGNIALNNTGSFITGINYDIDSTTRGSVRVDIGCDEFVPANTVNWIGKFSTDWFNPLNWEANVLPDATRDLSLSNGSPFLPVLNAQTALRNLSLSATGSPTLITLNTGATLQVFGSMNSNGGVVDALNAGVEMAGTFGQNIPQSFFKSNGIKDLLISNSSTAGVTLNGPLDIYRSLKFSNTGLKINTNDLLTLKSGLSQTAWVGDLTGKSITGKVTVERYIPTGVNHGKSWQFLSVPVNGSQTIQQAWQDSATSPNQNRYPGYGTQITGNTGGNATAALAAGFDVYTPAGSTIKTYNSVADNWQFIANTNNTPVSNTKGYFVFVRGDRGVITYNATATPTILRTKGNLYTAEPGFLPPTITVASNSFESVGNPYASAIDFRNLNRSAGVDQTFYVWDPLLNGMNGLGGFQFISAANGYRPIPGGTANYNNTVSYPFIQSGQAFLIHSNNGGGSLSFSESAKTEGSATTFREAADQQLLITLSSNNSNQFHVLDGSSVAISNTFSQGLDEYDVVKMKNPGEIVSIRNENNLLGLLSSPSWEAIDTIKLFLSNLRSINYRFSIQPENLIDDGYGLFLYDRFLQQEFLISSNTTNEIDFIVTTDTLSKAANRFYLVRKQISILPIGFEQIFLSKNESQQNIINWNFSGIDQVVQFEIEKSYNGKDFDFCGFKIVAHASDQFYLDRQQVGAPFYRIKAILKSGQFVYSRILSAQPSLTSKHPIIISANGSQQIQLYSDNCESGNYILNIYTSEGRLLESISFQVVDNHLNATFSLPKHLSRQIIVAGIFYSNRPQIVMTAKLFIH